MAFDTEIALYNKLLPELLRNADGKYVVIKEQRLLGVFTTHSEAYRAGLDAFGVVPFLLRAVHAEEPVYHFGLLNGGAALLHSADGPPLLT